MKTRRAFSLTETLVVLFLGAIVMMGAATIFILSTRSYQTNSASAELTQNARIALERTSRDIRQAVEILTPLPEDPQSGTPASELKFQDGHNFWPAGAGQETGQLQYITYYLSGTDLYRKMSHYAFDTNPDEWVLWSTINSEGEHPTEYTDTDQVKAEHVSSLQFWGVKTITINLTVSDDNNTFHFETKSLGRNIL